MTKQCDIEQRFAGIARIYGTELARHLTQTRICIIGIGGVGSWTAEALARCGLGYIDLIDDDVISVSNINRQIHALDNSIGQSKVELMKQRISLINPDCRVFACDDRISEKNCSKFFDRNHGLLPDTRYIIDAIDNVKAKAALIAYCRSHKISLITTGGAGGLSDPTQIGVADLSVTRNDPLAAKVRSHLRSHYNFPKQAGKKFGIECVFSNEQPVYPQADGGVAQQKPDMAGKKLDCQSGYGSLTMVTAGFGMLAASRIIERIRRQLQAAC